MGWGSGDEVGWGRLRRGRVGEMGQGGLDKVGWGRWG